MASQLDPGVKGLLLHIVQMSLDRRKEKIHAQLVSKAVLSPDETELFVLTQLAGVTMDQQVFKIILDLLKMNVPPVAIVQTLRSMCCPHKQASSVSGHSGKALDQGVSDRAQRRGDFSSQGQLELTQQSKDSKVRAGSNERQGRNSSHNNLTQSSNNYSQDGSSYTNFSSGKSIGDNSSRSHSHLASDTTYGRNDSRSYDSKLSYSSTSRADSFVTTRQVTGAADRSDSSRHKDSTSRKGT